MVLLVLTLFVCTLAIAQPKPEVPPKPQGVKPQQIREGEAADYGRWTRAPFIKGKIGPGGGDLGLRNTIQFNQSILNWEYRPGYMKRDSWWTRLKKEWYPDQLMQQSRAYKLQTEEIGAGLRSYWTGDMPATNRGSFEAIEAAKRADYRGDITVDKRVVQDAKAAQISAYQGNITTDKRIVQREKAEQLAEHQGNITTDKRIVQREKAEQLADWTGGIDNNKIEKERKKAAELSDWTGNYFTNKEEVERKKAEQIADYEGNWLNDKKEREERTAEDSRNFKGGIRIRSAYLRSHDSKSKYRVIPKGKRDSKEKDLWYD
jgi:hypothetical protein